MNEQVLLLNLVVALGASFALLNAALWLGKRAWFRVRSRR